MTLSRSDRQNLLGKITTLVSQKYYDPAFGGKNWEQIVSRHRDTIVQAETVDGFEVAVTSMLQDLNSSGMGLLGPTTKITPRSAINASFRRVETLTDGGRWVFQDVLPGGVAARAGVQPGDALISANGIDVASAQPPAFPMGERIPIVVSRNGDRTEKRLDLATASPKYKDNPYSEPDSVTAGIAADSVGTVKVSLFPGKIGIDFAKHVDVVFQEKIPNVKRLVIDLRGNPGGGIGGIQLMSYLTPSKVPIGYSLDRPTAERGYDKASLPRFDRVPKSKLEIPLLAIKFLGKKSVVLGTSGLGKQSFHGRVVVLVNEHTTGAAEMLAQFVQENGLGTIVGNKTPGRLVSRSAFKIGQDYRIVIPIGAYVSWKGNRIEGKGITPDVPVDWSYEEALAGKDNQMYKAIQFVQQLGSGSTSV
jgi:carboxyl-terminal processing protease